MTTSYTDPFYEKIIKVNKMKYTWKQRFLNWINKSLNENLPMENDRVINSDGFKFQLFRAVGGYIIETRYYDRISERQSNKLYIIKDEDDLGNAIGKIIIMENMR